MKRLQPVCGLSICGLLAVCTAGSALADNILFVSDRQTDTNIPTVLTNEGHSLTTVVGDFASGANPALSGDLSSFDAVFWSATGAGFGSTHNASTFANLSTYVSAGGSVFVTGYDSIASPTDAEMIAFLGGTGSQDVPAAPGPVANIANRLTTGVVDIRGVTPTGGHTDRDALSGLTGGTVGIVMNSSGPANWQWTLRALGGGEIAYVSNGAFQGSASNPHPSWEITSPGGPGAYNAALRNFAVPEPASLGLLAIAGLFALRRR
ncbi:MAG: PEP-CTERM sorting domain-containing protein [Planctomycetes bacterium]|nr:PEP-CTERM sorting domain-containing protein [Planctomycetota bacterium]